MFLTGELDSEELRVGWFGTTVWVLVAILVSVSVSVLNKAATMIILVEK